MPRKYSPPADRPRSHPYLVSHHPQSNPPPEAKLGQASSASTIPNFTFLPDRDSNNDSEEKSIYDATYFKLAQALQDANEVHPPPERLQCAACRIPITIQPTIDSDHSRVPVLWRLAHCRHPLHLDCLGPLGHPNAISKATQRPYYVHNPAATRIRRQKRFNPQFDHRPISRFEDAERMRTWPCPQEGCSQVQFSVLAHGDWYSNVDGMTIDGHSISGPTHL